MRANGLAKNAAATESKSGLMAACTRDSGSTIKPTASANYFMPMATFMKASGLMTKPLVMVPILTLTGPSTWGNGATTSKTGWAESSGPTELVMKAPMSTARRMGTESCVLRTGALMKALLP